MLSATPPVARVPLPLLLWRYFKGAVVLFVVVFHLAVLAVRNPLDLWYKEIRAWMKEHPADAEQSYWDRFAQTERSPLRVADNFTWKYTNLVGMEQRWVMFTPPMARSAPFLAVRLEFRDGTSEMILSPNEPEDPACYLRVGGWQLRKLEDYLAYPPEDLAGDAERSLWEGYALYKLHQWQGARPGDPRVVKRIVFVRRRLYFTEPNQTYADVEPPSERDLASFDARGNLLP